MSGRLLLIGLVMVPLALPARTVTEVYKGRVVREEVVRTEPVIDELTTSFFGMVNDRLAFRVSRTRRTVVWLRAYHEQVQITRNTEDPTDTGIRQLLPGQETPGDMRSETRVDDLGVVRGIEFRLPSGATLTTDKDGLLIDEKEVLLRHFDGMRPGALEVEMRSTAGGAIATLRLKPRELWAAVGSAESVDQVLATPDAGDLKISTKWDRPTYRPGDVARLRVTVHNQRQEGTIGFVRGAAAMSRHEWLDGRIFYVPPVPAGENRSFSRSFRIPPDFPLEVVHLRIGFNEYSGSKPQHAVRLRVRQLGKTVEQ